MRSGNSENQPAPVLRTPFVDTFLNCPNRQQKLNCKLSPGDTLKTHIRLAGCLDLT